MRGEFGQLRAQLKGYLFEIFLLILLKKNGFICINPAREPLERVRENRENFIELKGRGCWHQIDCPCDYKHLIPFSFPLRLLGEAKFYATQLDKKHIRAFIGVVKDIQENYFVADGVDLNDHYPRHTEIGVFFAANGFQAEAEKLAYAHGIKTISYVNNYLIDRIKRLIIDLEENFLSVQCLKDGNWRAIKDEIMMSFEYEDYENDNPPQFFNLCWADGYQDVLQDIAAQIGNIQSSFIGMSSTGVFIHFVGEQVFPSELFAESDEASCRVYFNYDNNRNRYFWLELSRDQRRRKFYFTPPQALDQAAVFGQEIILGEKRRFFRTLNVNIQLNGISRNLLLHIDTDWLDAVRDRIMQ